LAKTGENAASVPHKSSRRPEAHMRRILFVLFLSVALLPALCQTNSPKYEPGTIVAVDRHHEEPSGAYEQSARYDVTVQIGDTLYVALFKPTYGSNSVEYSPGLEFLFSVGKDALLLATPGKREGPTELPILSTTKLPAQPEIDWTKTPGQYFSMKMKNLTTNLNLSQEQQAKIKPIAEQESAEAGDVIFTPTVSRSERLKQWDKLVRASDAKMKPILTQAQWDKLQQMRKGQKVELQDLIAKQDSIERK
jgi:hypothetical protein